MSYASVEDVEELLGRDLTDAEQVIVNRRLDHAEDLIVSRIPDLAEKVTEDPRLARLLTIIEADCVLRLIRNINGLVSERDGAYGYRIDERVASGRLHILPEEWSLLGVPQVQALSINFGGVPATGAKPIDHFIGVWG